LSFDEGDRYAVDYRLPAASPDVISALIAGRLSP
jgi:hypothetical protein